MNDHFPFLRIPKAFTNHAVANADEQNSDLIPDLVEPIKSGPSTFEFVSTLLIS